MVEILPQVIGPAALGALAASTAIDIETAKATPLKENFLMKHVRASLTWLTPDAEDTILVGIARGEASVTNIKSALEDEQLNRDVKAQGIVRDVLMETVRMMHADVNGKVDDVFIDVSIGGGKGIPFEKTEGWKWFAYNIDNADLVAGGEVIGFSVVNGVWL